MKFASWIRTVHIFFVLFLCWCGCSDNRYRLGLEPVPTHQMPLDPMLRPELGMHTAPIRKIVADDDRRFIVTGSLDKTVRVWKADTGELRHVLRVPVAEGNEGKIYAVAISPNGKTIAVAGWTGITWEAAASIYLFESDSGRLLYRIPGLANVVHHLAFSRLGNFLVATLGGDSGIRIYRTLDYVLIKEDRRYGGAAYAADFDSAGRLVTVCQDGFLRMYDSDFSLLARVPARDGKMPCAVTFAPDGLQLAVAFARSREVDVYAARDLGYLFSPESTGLGDGELCCISWASDGSLYAGGTVSDAKSGKKIVRRWYEGGRGKYEDMTVSRYELQYLYALSDGSVAFAAAEPAWGILYENSQLVGKTAVTVDYRGATLRTSPDGLLVQFCYETPDQFPAYFSINSLAREEEGVSLSQPKDAHGKYLPLFPPLGEAPEIPLSDWKNGAPLALRGEPLPLPPQTRVQCLAIAPGRNGFVVGGDSGLYFFDGQGQEMWRAPLPGSARTVDIARDGKKVVAALADGTIRWYDAGDGKELLAFLPHRDRKRWIAWTPSGLYAAASNSNDLVKKHKNKSSEAAPDSLPLAPSQRRPREVALALGVTTRDETRPAPEGVQLAQSEEAAKTSEIRSPRPPTWQSPDSGSNKPNLYLLAVGVSNYQDTRWKLDFAAKDAENFAEMMQQNQGNLYGKVVAELLGDDKANRSEILRALDSLLTVGTAQDVIMVFLSGHGEMDQNGFYYFLPYNFRHKDLARSAVPFAQIQKTAALLQGKAIFFIDTCRSGGVMGGRRIDISAVIGELAGSKNELVVFASSAGSQESLENQAWGNGAFTKSLLEGLAGKADFLRQKTVSVQSLSFYVSARVKELTQGRQTPTIAIPNSIADFTIVKCK
jgi:WD40 repeat protein